MTTQKFSKGEAIRFGWDTTKSNLRFFIGLLIVVGLIWFVPSIIISRLNIGKEAQVLSIIISIIIAIFSWVLQLVVTMGLIRTALRFCDNEKGEFGDLFSCLPLFFKYLFGSILYMLIIYGGMILLIIPGIIWAIQFWFFNYFIVDKGLGPIEALKKSSAITRGAKWDLSVFGLLLIFINLLGALCLLIGLFATIPTTIVAMAFVYRKLLAQMEPAQVPEASSGETLLPQEGAREDENLSGETPDLPVGQPQGKGRTGVPPVPVTFLGRTLKFALIFIVIIVMILGAVKFGGDFLRGRNKKEELVITPPLVSQPKPQVAEEKKEETPQEKLEKLKKEIEENPRDVVKRAQLAHLYFLEGKIALSLLEYKKIITLAPKSNEEKEALNWIDKQQYTALSEWKNTLAKKFQEPALLLEYGQLSDQLSTISQKFTQGISPTTTLSPTLQSPVPTLPGQPIPATPTPTSLTPPYIITYPPAAAQYYPYLQQYLTPQVMPQPTLPK